MFSRSPTRSHTHFYIRACALHSLACMQGHVNPNWVLHGASLLLQEPRRGLHVKGGTLGEGAAPRAEPSALGTGVVVRLEVASLHMSGLVSVR